MLIERDGYDQVTTRHIALAAGLSVGAVYEYFPNKDAIVLQVGTTWMARIRSATAALHPDSSGISDGLTYISRVLTAVEQIYRDQPGLIAVVRLMYMIPDLREAVRDHDTAMVASLCSALKTFASGARDAEIDATAHCLYAMTHAILADCLVARTGDPVLMLPKLHAAAFALIAPLMLPSYKQPGR